MTMNLGKILLRLIPFVGGYLQKRDASEARGESQPYSGFFSNVESALSSAASKYLGTSLTGAEREANAFTAEQSQLAWERSQKSADIAYQRELEASNTQYQRKVADLQAAGLNPMLAVASGGSAIPSASVASASPGSSVSPGSANLGGLISAIANASLASSQRRNIDADTKLKESEAAQNTQQINYFERVKDFRAEAESLAGSIKHSEWKQIEQNISESKSRVSKFIAETNESERRAELITEQAVLSRVEADNIVYMQPFLSAELTARTSQEKAQCRLIAVEEAYQQKLIDEGAIEAAVRASNSSASNSEIEAKTKEFIQAIRDGSLRSAAEKSGDWRSYITLGIYQGLSNAVKAARGNW